MTINRRVGLVGAVLALLLVPAIVSAQQNAFEPDAPENQNRVVVVPYSQITPTLPHPAHEGMHMTLKGIIRNAQCGTYDVVWDVDRDGVFGTPGNNNESSIRVSKNNSCDCVRDIGQAFKAPNV